MARWVGWVLGAVTAPCLGLGLGCDAPRPPVAKPIAIQRAFPETADFRDDSSLVHDRPGAPVAAAAAPARPSAAAASPAEPGPRPTRSERVAALLLMLPTDVDDPAGSRSIRTYKVSLGPDLTEALVEIDGRDLGPMPVGRVYPQATGPGRGRPPIQVPLTAVPRLAGPGTEPAGSPYGDAPRARTARRSGDGSLPTTQARMLNPNGAPIID